MINDLNVFRRLSELILSRKETQNGDSYTESLFSKGHEYILKKLSEESAEVLMASKDLDAEHVVREVADLWFHCLVVMAYHGKRVEDIALELEKREGLSGIAEKSSRLKDV